MHITRLESTTFSIHSVTDTTNDEYNSCGYNAFVLATGLNVSIEDFRTITNEHANFELEQI